MKRLLFLLLAALFVGCDSMEMKDATVDSRVINGEAASVATGGIVNSVVRVQLTYPDGVDGFCSGVVVTPSTVMTSGHCLVEGAPKVVSVSASDGTVVGLKNYAVHPDFRVDPDAGAIFGDVALLFVTSPLPVASAPLLQSIAMNPAETVTVAGFGVDENGELGILKFGNMVLSLVTENHLLAMFSGEASNTCNGDSGGPAIGHAVTIDGNGLEGIVGLTSSGLLEDCGKGDTTYFTNLQNPGIVSWLIEQEPGIVLN